MRKRKDTRKLTTRNNRQWCGWVASLGVVLMTTADDAYLPRLGPSPLRFGDSFPVLAAPHLAADYDPRIELAPLPPPATNTVPVAVLIPPVEPVVRTAGSPRPELPPTNAVPVGVAVASPDVLDPAGDGTGRPGSKLSAQALIPWLRRAVGTSNGVQEIIVPLPFLPASPGEGKSSRATFEKP